MRRTFWYVFSTFIRYQIHVSCATYYLVFITTYIDIKFTSSVRLGVLVLGKTLNSSVVVLRMTLNSLGAIWEMIPSVAAICADAVDFPCWSYPTFCAASLRAGPVGCISYNMYFVDAPLVTLGVSGV